MLYNANNLKELQDERLRLLCELRQLEDAEKAKLEEESLKKSEALQAPPTLICLKGCTPSVLHDAIPPSPSTHTQTHTGPCSH